MMCNEGDSLAAYLAKESKPPTGRVHLHAFVRRNSLYRAAIYEDGDVLPSRLARTNVLKFPKRHQLVGKLDWRVVTRRSSVCDVPGRCILADIVEPQS